MDEQPYVGPVSIATDQRIFGRAREAAELRYLLTSERIVLLYSPSGAGKSSLMQAGLIPRLKERFEIWGPVRVNAEPPAGSDANRYVWSAITSLGLKDVPPPMTLREYVAQRPRESNPVIIFDQFEEVLRVDQLDGSVKREFFRQLGDLLEDRNIWALIILREDYLAQLDPYASLIPTNFSNRFRIDRLSRKAALEAVEGPTEFTARKYAPGVAKRIVENLASVRVPGTEDENVPGEFVEPLQLQVVCLDLWNRVQKKRPDDSPIVETDLGDLSSSLKRYYDKSVSDAAFLYPDVEREIREWFGNELITADGVRNQVRREARTSAGLPNELVGILLDSYLVRPEPRAGQTWYELSHDRLVVPIQESNREWFDAHLNKLERAARLWQAQNENAGLLWLGAELKTAEAEAASAHLQPLEREFLDASRQEQDDRDRKVKAARRDRIQSIVIRWLGAAALLVAAAAAYEAYDARQQKKGALAEKAVAKAATFAAEGAKKDALDQRDKLNTSLIALGKAEGESTRHLGEAETFAKQAQTKEAEAGQNLVRLFAEKSDNALATAFTQSSSDGYMNAWMYTVAAMAKSNQPVPVAAGRLLRAEVLPGYKPPTAPAVRPIAKSVAIALLPHGIAYKPAGDGAPACVDSCPADLLKDAPKKVMLMAIDGDGKSLAMATESGTVSYKGRSIRDVETDLTALAVDGDSVALGVGSQVVLTKKGMPDLWTNDAPCEVEGRTLNASKGCAQRVGAITFVPGRGDSVAVGGVGGDIRFYTANGSKLLPSTGRPVVIRTGRAGISSIVLWPQSDLIVSGHGDGTVKLSDMRTGSVVAEAPLHDDAVIALRFDDHGGLLTTAAKDGSVHKIDMHPTIFGRKWDIQKLLDQRITQVRAQLYAVSRTKLGFDPRSEEPLAGLESSSLALGYFSTGGVRHFTREEAAERMLLWRQRLPATVSFPSIQESEILLMPNDTDGSRSAVFHKTDLKSGFKAEFEYRVRNLQPQPINKIGDGFSFMFFKDRAPYDEKSQSDGDFAFVPGSGYAVAFNAYNYTTRGLRLYTPAFRKGDKLDTAYNAATYTGDTWRKACIEVDVEPGASQCAASGPPAAKPFQGVRVYIDGRFAYEWPITFDTRFGGVGFGSATGEAIAEQTVRNVMITPAGGNNRLTFQAGNSVLWARGNKNPTDTYPAFVGDHLMLTEDQKRFQAAAVLLDEKVWVPKDFAIDFEYSMQNRGSPNPSATGDGLVFLFGKDRAPYRTAALPEGEGRAFIPGSGYGIHFVTHNRRAIELRDAKSALLATSYARSLPDIFTDGKWRRVRVEVSTTAGRVRVLYENVEVLNNAIDLPDGPAGIGFGAATSPLFEEDGMAEHSIRNVVIHELNPGAAH